MAHQQRQPALAPQPAPVLRELSALEAALEVGVRETAPALAPAPPSLLDTVASEPVARWSRGRRITVSHEVIRQDEDLHCVGGLFGAVEEATEPSRPVHGQQIPLGAVATDRGTGICICGDKGCGIGPFVRVG
jgi:hypothetical protein